MKAFSFNELYQCEHPRDMKLITMYLKTVGDIHVSTKELENLYHRHSSETYCVNWMELSDETLESFALWLSNVDVEDMVLNWEG